MIVPVQEPMIKGLFLMSQRVKFHLEKEQHLDLYHKEIYMIRVVII
jgi:hypothetical protein